GEVVDVTVEGQRDASQVGGHRPGEVHLALGRRPHDELLHVSIRRLEQATALCQGDHGHGVVDHPRRDTGSFHRIHGDVDVPRVVTSPAELLTYVQHGRLVALSFTYDYLAVDVKFVENAPHGIGTRLIDEVGIALARHTAGRDGGLLR